MASRWPVLALALVPLSFPLAQLGRPHLPVPLLPLVTVAAITLVWAQRSARRLPVMARSPVILALGFLVASALASTLVAADPVASVRLDGDYLLGLGLAAATAVAVTDRDAARALIGWVCLIGAGMCGEGLLTAAPLKVHYGASLVENRATGLFVQPNELGAFAALIVILSAALLFSFGRRDARRWLAAACLAISVAAVLITLSRGAWLGLALGFIVLLVLAPAIRRTVLATLGVLFGGTLVILLAGPPQSIFAIFADRAASFVDGSRNPYDDRPQIWTEALRQLMGHPWLGSGPGGYPFLASRSPSAVIWVAPEHAHNLILTVASEQGAIGVVALGLVVAAAVAGIAGQVRRTRTRARAFPRRRYPDHAGDPGRVLVAGVAAALAVVLGQGLLDYPLRNSVLATLVWLLLGLLTALGSATRTAGEQPTITVHRGAHMTTRHPFNVESRAADGRGPRAAGRSRARRWSPVIAASLAAAGTLATSLAVIATWPTSYAATSIVSITPKPDTIASADFIQVLGEKYVVIATSPGLMQAAAGAVGVDPVGLGQSTTATLSAGTGNVEITVDRPDRGTAVNAANALADLIVKRSASDALAAAEVTSSAVASRAKTKPPRPLLMAAGSVGAVLLGLLVWFVLAGRARTHDPLAGDPDSPPRTAGSRARHHRPEPTPPAPTAPDDLDSVSS